MARVHLGHRKYANSCFGLLFVLIGFGSDLGDPLYEIGGLIQRALIAVAFGWATVTAGRLLRRWAN